MLEIADVIAIHKADLPRADQVEAQVHAMLGLSSGIQAPVLRVSSRTGAGIESLWAAIECRPLRRNVRPRDGRGLVRAGQERLASLFVTAQVEGRAELNCLLARWQQGGLSEIDAADALIKLLQEEATQGRHEAQLS